MAWVQFSMTLQDLQATTLLGHSLGQALEPGEHLALEGAMGAGKTTLTRALAQGFGVLDLDDVASPTYAYAHIYNGARGTLHHLDFYRLHDEDSAINLGLDALLQDPCAVAVVEWADRFAALLHPQALWLTLSREPQTSARTAVLRVPEARAQALLQALPAFAGPFTVSRDPPC